MSTHSTAGLLAQKPHTLTRHEEAKRHRRMPAWINATLEIIGVALFFLIPTFWVFGVPFFLFGKIFS